MSRKVLFVATVLRMHVLVFHLPYMRWFQEQGYEVHLCCANDTPDPHPQVPSCDRWVELPFSRSPFSADNREVFRRLKQLIDAEDYALIHCNTPVGGLLGRLAARAARKRGTRVVYTAHGFHFFTGAPLKNWLLYYPAERLLSRWTDLLITINGEDYARAKRFAAGRVALVSGVGVDLARFRGPVDRAAVRAGLSIGPEDAVLITVGEHSERKNHETVIAAAAPIEGAHVLFCGVGDRQAALEKQARELDMEDRVHFLGFRKDIPALLAASDVFVFPSLQEGLPVAQMEAMARGASLRGQRCARQQRPHRPRRGRLSARAARRERLYAGYRAPPGGPGPARAHGRAQPPRDAPLQPGGGACPDDRALPRPAGRARAMTEGGCGCGVGAVSDALSAGEGR